MNPVPSLPPVPFLPSATVPTPTSVPVPAVPPSFLLEVCVTANLEGSRSPVTHTSVASLLAGLFSLVMRAVDVLSINLAANMKCRTPTAAWCPIASAVDHGGSRNLDTIAHAPAGSASFQRGIELAEKNFVGAAAVGLDKGVGVYDSVTGSRA